MVFPRFYAGIALCFRSEILEARRFWEVKPFLRCAALAPAL